MEAAHSKSFVCVSVFITLAVAGVIEVVALGVGWPYRLISSLSIGLATAGLAHAAVAAPLRRQVGMEQQRARRLADEFGSARRHWELIGAGGRAIDLAADEVQVLSALTQTAAAVWPQRTVQLLLCSSDGAHGTWLSGVDGDGLLPPVELDGDGRCRALLSRRPMLSDSTNRLDACPHLHDQDASSSVCIPIATHSGTIAALSSIGAPGDLPNAGEIDDLESLARRAGSQLDLFAPPHGLDDTDIVDPLSGLPNHRTAHREIKRLIGGLTPFSLAVCDLDNFSAYNDTNGFEAGNRAIKLYAGALRSTLRPGDVVCRYGDDAFLVVFPRCSSLNAQAAMERVRESMVLEASGAEISPFTCSVGVADSNQGHSIDELIDTADLALSLAKQDGGNRVRLALFESAE